MLSSRALWHKLSFVALLALSATVRAQVSLPSGTVAYAGLNHTPLGLLGPLVTPTMIDSAHGPFAVAGQFGALRKSNGSNPTSALAASGIVSVGSRASFYLTVG